MTFRELDPVVLLPGHSRMRAQMSHMHRQFTILAAGFLVGFAPSRTNAQWRIDPKPLLDIGGAAAADEYLFVFLSGAARLSNGNIVALDANAKELKVFDRTGRLLKKTGQRGEGPGDFQSPGWLAVTPGDTILIWDSRGSLGFLNKFSADGRFLSRRMVDGDTIAFNPWPLRYMDGALIVDGQDRGRACQESDCPAAPTLDGRVRRAVARSTADRVERIFAYPGADARDRFATWRVSGLVAVNDSLLFMTTGETSSITVIGLTDRRVRGTIVSTVPRHRITSADIAEWKAYIEKGSRESPVPRGMTRQQMTEGNDRMIRDATFADYLPFFGAFRIDDLGNLWVRYSQTIFDKATRWTVFDPSRRKLADIVLPAGFTVLQIAPDMVLGRWVDEDHVHHLRMYRLIK